MLGEPVWSLAIENSTYRILTVLLLVMVRNQAIYNDTLDSRLNFDKGISELDFKYKSLQCFGVHVT